jgi:hypothetical protein
MNDKKDPQEIPDTGGDFRSESEQLHLNDRQAHAFEEIFAYLDEVVSPAERDALNLSVTQIMVEAARGEHANEALLWKQMDDLRRTHPHVLQKLLDSLNATGTGFHIQVRRVVERMAEQINNPSPDQETF